MTVIRWVLGGAAAAGAVWIIILNWMIFWQGLVQRKATPSLIPFLGAVTGTAALLILPIPVRHWFCWIPFIVDWGALPAMAVFVWKFKRGQSDHS
jgi:hypothetical protein